VNLTQRVLHRPAAVVFAVLVAAGSGIVAYLGMPAAIVPQMSFSRVDVVADAGNLPPEQVRTAITLPLEQALLGVQGVTRVRATSSQGSSELIVTFDEHTDPQRDLQLAQAAIDQTRAQLPAGTAVSAQIVLPTSEPIVSYAFVSRTLSPTLLHEMAQYDLAPRFYGIPGLARILVIGGPPREYRVNLDPAAMATHGLRVGDVESALADAARVDAAGIVQRYYGRSVLLVDAGLGTASALARVEVPTPAGAAVPLGALGTVRLSTAPPTVAAGFDGRPAVLMNFYALPGADAVRMAQIVASRMHEVARNLPVGTSVHEYWNQTAIVAASQASLRDAILLGAILAVGVIMLFLRNARMTLIAAVVIPVAMAISVFAMSLLGETLNVMSVGGLAVAVGLIIDDAIVVIENIARNLHRFPEMGKAEIVVLSMRELGAPMTASTLTTVVVFVPLALLTGVSGFFFRALAVTLAAALLVSLGLALAFTPLLARRLMPDARSSHDDRGIITVLLSRYDGILRAALARRRVVYASAAVILATTIIVLAKLPSDFLPRLDEGEFEIGYRLPVGTTLAASDAAARTMERIVLQDPAVLSVGRQTGIDTNGFTPTQVRDGTLRVVLRPIGERPSYDVVSARLRSALERAVPDARLNFHQLLEDMIDDVSGAPAPVEIVLHGGDEATLQAAATSVARAIGRVSGVVDVSSGIVADDPLVRVIPHRRILADVGLSTSGLLDALAATTQGTVATTVPGAQAPVPVRVTMRGAQESMPAQRLVATSAGVVPLSALADVFPPRLSTDLVDQDGTRVAIVTGNFTGANLSGIVGGIRDAIRHADLPPQVSYTLGGAYRLQQRSFSEFARVIAVAVTLVFFVMLVSFGNLRQPLVILATIPLALIGVALGLLVTHTPLNVSSFMGLLLLVGIVVKNGILLLDVAERRRFDGMAVTDALVIAGRTRLRPIVMTALAAIGGLLPLAIGLGAGSELERPLAIAVIGGLSTATAFTLVVIPVLYASVTKENAV